MHYGGMNRQKGEIFEVAPEYVNILTQTKSAKPVEDEKESDAKRYKRRDMRAED